MDFEDFSAYLKTLSLPSAYQKAIGTLKPYGSVIISFERTLGQPGDSLVLSDPEALALVYQFVYWALRRDAVDINVPLNQLPPTEVGGLFLSSVVKRLKADSLPKDSVL